jgi:hypothetical protein
MVHIYVDNMYKIHIIHCVYNETVSISDYIGSKSRIVNERWSGNVVDGRGCHLFQFIIQHSSGEQNKTLKSLRRVGVPAEILTCYFSNYSEEILCDLTCSVYLCIPNCILQIRCIRDRNIKIKLLINFGLYSEFIAKFKRNMMSSNPLWMTCVAFPIK